MTQQMWDDNNSSKPQSMSAENRARWLTFMVRGSERDEDKEDDDDGDDEDKENKTRWRPCLVCFVFMYGLYPLWWLGQESDAIGRIIS